MDALNEENDLKARELCDLYVSGGGTTREHSGTPWRASSEDDETRGLDEDGGPAPEANGSAPNQERTQNLLRWTQLTTVKTRSPIQEPKPLKGGLGSFDVWKAQYKSRPTKPVLGVWTSSRQNGVRLDGNEGARHLAGR